MRRPFLGLLLAQILIAVGCMTSYVNSNIDLNEPFLVLVLVDGNPAYPDPVDGATMVGVLRNWIPVMKAATTTYPTPRYKLILKGQDETGSENEERIFVGRTWIGNGVGVVTIPDDQAIQLINAIEATIANQSLEVTQLAGARSAPQL